MAILERNHGMLVIQITICNGASRPKRVRRTDISMKVQKLAKRLELDRGLVKPVNKKLLYREGMYGGNLVGQKVPG